MTILHYHPIASESSSGNLLSEDTPLFKDMFFGEDFYRGWAEKEEIRINVYETDEQWEYFVELPGVKESELKVAFEEGHIKVSGERTFEESSEKITKYHLREIGDGYFERWLHVHEGANMEGISASLKNGLLKITIPKLETSKTKLIEVKCVD